MIVCHDIISTIDNFYEKVIIIIWSFPLLFALFGYLDQQNDKTKIYFIL